MVIHRRRTIPAAAWCLLAVLAIAPNHSARPIVPAAASPLSAPAKWSAVSSPNFLIVGNVGEKDLRGVAMNLEQFREALHRLLPEAPMGGDTPTVVVAFGTREAYAPFLPVRGGKRVAVGGLFVGNHDVNYVSLSLEGQGDAYPVIFHEFTHLFLRGNPRRAPLWFTEGVAEYYSSFQLTDGGARAIVGRPIEHRLRELRRIDPNTSVSRAVRLVPLADLLDADMSSEILTQESTRSLFYAQAWIWTHYLLVGNPSRRGQLMTFLGLLSSDVPRPQAFRQAFGAEPDALDRELREYVQSVGFREERVVFSDPITVDAARLQPVPLSEAAAQARLGDLLLHMNRLDEAESRLQAALALDSDVAIAHSALGLLRMRQNRVDEGIAEFGRAIALDPGSHAVHYAFGAELLQHSPENSVRVLDAARVALERGAELRPDSAKTLGALGEVYLLGRVRLDEARRVLERAVSLAPWDERHLLTLAQVYVQQREFARARVALGGLVAHGENDQVREAARTLLESSLVQEGGLQARRPAAEPEKAPIAPAEPAGLIVPLRPLGPGEQRIEGVLQRIDCWRNAVMLRLRTADGPLRLTAAHLGRVEFTTYRNRPMGPVRCGARPAGDHVVVTWRPAPSGPRASSIPDGVAVAVAFVPADFRLR